MAWMLLAGAIVSEVFGTMSLRLAVGQRLWYLGVALGYLSAFSLLSLALSHGIPLGVAYGIWAAAGVALTALLSRVLFKEPFTWLMRLGVVLVIGGVLLIETGTA